MEMIQTSTSSLKADTCLSLMVCVCVCVEENLQERLCV